MRPELGVQVSPLQSASSALGAWLDNQKPETVILFQHSSDEPSADRANQQMSAISGQPHLWCLGQAAVNSIPRSAIYPVEYSHRDFALLSSREELYFRSNLCLHAGSLAAALPNSGVATEGPFTKSIVAGLDPVHLVELPLEVSRIRPEAYPATRRAADSLEMARRSCHRFLGRAKRRILRIMTP